MTDSVQIAFEPQQISLDVATGSDLKDVLDATNSPILFGCRTGICGTCAIRVKNIEDCRPQTEAEKEFFESVGREEEVDLRLACQLSASQSLVIEKVKV